MNKTSKQLTNYDESGFLFVKEMLGSNVTAAINFDRIQKHPTQGYIIFEFLLCEESQRWVTPHTSHPNRYWHKNKRKFIALYQLACDIPATLYLVNYAKYGTRHADEVLVIKVTNVTESGDDHVQGINEKMTREQFKEWFSKLNEECL